MMWYDARTGKVIETKKEKGMSIEKENGVLVTLTNETTEIVLGVALSIAGTYALVGWWLEEDEKLNEALAFILYDEPVNGAIVQGYTHGVPSYGSLYFKKIVVVVDTDDD